MSLPPPRQMEIEESESMPPHPTRQAAARSQKFAHYLLAMQQHHVQ